MYHHSIQIIVWEHTFLDFLLKITIKILHKLTENRFEHHFRKTIQSMKHSVSSLVQQCKLKFCLRRLKPLHANIVQKWDSIRNSVPNVASIYPGGTHRKIGCQSVAHYPKPLLYLRPKSVFSLRPFLWPDQKFDSYLWPDSLIIGGRAFVAGFI